MKTCFKCKTKKELHEFYKHKQMADGHLNKCKLCAQIDSESYRLANIEYVRHYDRNRPNKEQRREYDQARSENPIRKKNKVIWNAKYRKKYPLKAIAHGLLALAIEDGRIKRESCSKCKSANAHGHHEDYTKPLDVIWLCDKHHKARHKELNEELRKIESI